MISESIYAYIWMTSRKNQIRICFLTAAIVPLSIIPLEIQRRVVDQAIAKPDLKLLYMLGAAYLLVVLIQGGLKYVLNLTKGLVLEEVTRDLRNRILVEEQKHVWAKEDALSNGFDDATAASIVAAEAEDIGGFASDSLALPLLQAGTMIWVVTYLIWVQPLIAGLALIVYLPQMILVPKVQRTINLLARRRTGLVRKLNHEIIHHVHADEEDPTSHFSRSHKLIEKLFKTRMRIYRHKYFLTFLGNFLNALGPIIVLMVGGYLVIHGQTDVGTLLVFITGFQKLSDPSDQLINFYRAISNARVSYTMVRDILAGGIAPAQTVAAAP